MSKTDALTRMIESDCVHISGTTEYNYKFHSIVIQEDTVFSKLEWKENDNDTAEDALEERLLNSKTLKQGALITISPNKSNDNERDRYFSKIKLASGSAIIYLTEQLA
jgi:hypothetical protein